MIFATRASPLIVPHITASCCPFKIANFFQIRSKMRLKSISDNARVVTQTFLSKPTPEGDGATVWRSIGRPEMKTLDPFLLLDEARVKPPAGFPDHPHRGFETVSYLLKGAMTHEDFAGHVGQMGPGDLQWMTAGRGIMHSELPAGQEKLHGLQLWVNLAAKDKMWEPAYQELKSQDIPAATSEGVTVKVISGQSMGVVSPVYTRTPTMFLDVTLQPGAAMLDQAVPEGWNAFVYTLEGTATIGTEDAPPTLGHHTCRLRPGGGVSVWDKGGEVCRFVLLAGQPLNEAVVQYGPFVMNTQEEIMQTMRDYQQGENGFERAVGWKSSKGRQNS